MKDNKYAWGPGRLHEPGFLMSEFLETNPMIGPCEPFGGKTDKTSAHDIVKNCVARKFEYLLHFQRNIVIAAYWFREDYIYIGRLKLWFCYNKCLPCPGLWKSRTRQLQVAKSRISQPQIEAPAFNGTLIDFPAGGMFGKWFLKRPCGDFGWSLGKETHHMLLAI